MLDGILGHGPEPVRIALSTEEAAPHPPRVCIAGLDEGPLPAFLQHAQRLTRESLCYLLGLIRRIGPQGRELACERMFA